VYADLILSHGPIAYWRFGEPENSVLVEDAVGAKDGASIQVVRGVPGAIAGDPDTAFSFDGAGAKVDIPDASELFTFAGTAHHSFELWFKSKPYVPTTREPTPPIQFLLEKRTGADVTTRDGNTLLLYADSLSPAIERWTSGSAHVSSSQPPAVDVWHHIAFTFDGQKPRVYVDGAMGSDPGTSTGDFGPNGSALTIGAANSGGSPFDGDIDEVAVYDRALSADEIFEHFTAGLGP
jgi:hyaluronoglucosaminidase